MNELAPVDKGSYRRRLKALVLDSVSSPITKRVYNLRLDEFIAWYLLHRVLMNFAVNARDAMPNGGRLLITLSNVDIGETRSPRLAAVEPGPYVRLSVTNSGMGMSLMCSHTCLNRSSPPRKRLRGADSGSPPYTES